MERRREGERVCVLREMMWINGVKVLQQKCGSFQNSTDVKKHQGTLSRQIQSLNSFHTKYSEYNSSLS